MIDDNLPSVPAALSDIEYLETVLAGDWVYADIDPKIALDAARSLAAAIKEIRALQTSRIGADDYLKHFASDPTHDGPSFYRGVGFALARVNSIIRGKAS